MVIDNEVLQIHKAQMTSQESRTPKPPEKIAYLCLLLKQRIWRQVWVGSGVEVEASDIEETDTGVRDVALPPTTNVTQTSLFLSHQ